MRRAGLYLAETRCDLDEGSLLIGSSARGFLVSCCPWVELRGFLSSAWE